MKFQVVALLLLNFGLILSEPLNYRRQSVAERFAQLQERAQIWYAAKYGNRSEAISPLVENGVEVLPGEAPFQAQLNLFDGVDQISFTCGGSLISARTILSAGHCVDFNNNYLIRYGSNNRLQSPYPLAEVAQIKLHPGFSLETLTNDVSLFVLRRPLQPASNVAAITLTQGEPSAGTPVTVYGFGLENGQDQNSLAVDLQKATLNIVPEQDCANFVNSLGINKTPGQICAWAQDRASCNGDSGGPLVIQSNGLQAGIVSFGVLRCPIGAMDVFTNVAYYYPWIRDNVVV